MVTERQYADLVLGLLLGWEGAASQAVEAPIQWDLMLRIARDNRVAIRLYDRLLQLGVQPDDTYRAYVITERERIRRVICFMERIGELCETTGTRYAYMKNNQHYPDMGDDIDLLVLNQDKAIDREIVGKFHAHPDSLNILNRFAGKTQYYIDDYSIYLEIHHGRMGRIGEHTLFPRLLMEHRRPAQLNDARILVPSPEDQLLVQTLQRVYGHFYLRISEVVYLVTAISTGRFDFEYVIATARQIGVLGGLRHYLSCINAVCRAVHNEGLSLSAFGFPLPGLGEEVTLEFRGSHYFLPLLTVGSKLYGEKLWSDTRARNWDGMFRLSLMPFAVALVGLQNLLERTLRAPRGR